MRACVTAVRGSAISRLQQRDRPRRGGDHLPRPLAKAQPELQHIERCFGMAPLGELIEPGGGKLRPAQTFLIFRREHLRHRAVRPFQPPPRRDPLRPLVVPIKREQAGDALDHHLAHIVLGLADQRDARRGIVDRTLRTHSAPARVLPAPRPPSISQVVQSSPLPARSAAS